MQQGLRPTAGPWDAKQAGRVALPRAWGWSAIALAARSALASTGDVAPCCQSLPSAALACAHAMVSPSLRPAHVLRVRAQQHVSANAPAVKVGGQNSARRLVGLGSACVDLLAAVDAYPQPDAKIRTRSLTVTGGGNTANQLTAAARLGPWLRPRLWSKLGDDAYGKDICAGLAAEDVDCSEVVVEAGSASPFTYILVDLAKHTRTCIHTPGPATRREELLGSAVDRLLEDAALCCFDGRLADAALVLADAAVQRGIPCLVEAEKPREGLDALLKQATTVCTSAAFPMSWTAQAELPAALLAMWERLPRAQVIVTTLGSEGSVALQRCPPPGGDTSGDQIVDAAALGNALSDLKAATAGAPPAPAAGSPPVPRTCVSGPISRIWPSSWGRVLFTPAAVVHPSDVVDTTGAGDAFIGSLAFGLIEGLQLERTLALASWVAAHKCRLPGPRPGLPRREQVPPQLLHA